MTVTDSAKAEVLRRFLFHPATPATGPLHDEIRQLHSVMASRLMNRVPPGRHLSLALTALQESMMWANAGIACDTVVAVDRAGEATVTTTWAGEAVRIVDSFGVVSVETDTSQPQAFADAVLAAGRSMPDSARVTKVETDVAPSGGRARVIVRWAV